MWIYYYVCIVKTQTTTNIFDKVRNVFENILRLCKSNVILVLYLTSIIIIENKTNVKKKI